MILSAFDAFVTFHYDECRIESSQFRPSAQRTLDHTPSAYRILLAVLSALIRLGLFELGSGTAGRSLMPCSTIIAVVVSRLAFTWNQERKENVNLGNKTA
jgi:hypothetical protein